MHKPSVDRTRAAARDHNRLYRNGNSRYSPRIPLSIICFTISGTKSSLLTAEVIPTPKLNYSQTAVSMLRVASSNGMEKSDGILKLQFARLPVAFLKLQFACLTAQVPEA